MFGCLIALPLIAMAAPAKQDTFLHDFAVSHRFSSGVPTSVTVTPDGATVLFLRADPTSSVQSLFAFDVATGATRELLRPDALLKGASATVSPEEKARLERQRIRARGFTGFTLSRDGRRLVAELSGRAYVVDLASAHVTPIAREGVLDPKLSPDGRFLAYVWGHDLYVTDLSTLKEHSVTTGGSPGVSHGLAEFVAQEEMRRFSGYAWSPSSSSLVYEESDTRGVERLAITDPLHPERDAYVVPFPRAGTANAKVRVGVVPVGGGPTAWVSYDVASYPYLATIAWQDYGPLSLVVQNRAQTEELLLAVDPRTGRTRTLLTERDRRWLTLDQRFPLWLKDGSFLWRTERNGASEVERRAPDGQRRGSWLPPATHFESLVRLVEPEGPLYFLAAPKSSERVLMSAADGGRPEPVLREGGPRVQAGVVSRDGSTVVVEDASVKGFPRWRVLHRGSEVGELPSVARVPPFMPKVELHTVGAERFETFVVRPQKSRPGRKLPVIVSVYGGPTANHVEASAKPYLLEQWLADQGFIVVGADNRGTPARGWAWERAVKGNFADIPLDDQVSALRALAREVPEMDLARVGMFGWSFGGYMAALSVLKRPDVFKAAVAGAPVVDWRDYDTHYTERYLGLPSEAPDAYVKSSLLSYAPGLQGRLLLIHGTADDNVYFFHSLKLSDALLRAGKAHEFLPLPGQTHGVSDPAVVEPLWRRVAEFFSAALARPDRS